MNPYGLLLKSYSTHMERMKKLQSPEELKRRDPEGYKAIQSVVRAMDTAWYREDMQGFKKAMQELERLYMEAIAKAARL